MAKPSNSADSVVWTGSHLGDMTLQKITVSQFRGSSTSCFVMVTEGMVSNDPSPPKSVSDCIGLLRQALNQAIEWDISMKGKVPKPARKEPQIMTEDQFAALLGKFESTCAHMLALMFYNTGVRLGEVLALSWEDVDLAEHTLEVRRSYSLMDENGNPIFKKPKTRAGKRTVEIGAILSGALQKHRAHQAERKLGAGSSWQNHHDLVCTKGDGSALVSKTVGTQFTRNRRHWT